MVWNPWDDDNPVVVVGEGLVVTVGSWGVSTDGRSCCDWGTGPSIKESFHRWGILGQKTQNKLSKTYGGTVAQCLAYLLLGRAALGLIPSIPKNISGEKIVDVGEVYQRRCLEGSGQQLENVDGTHWQASTTRRLSANCLLSAQVPQIWYLRLFGTSLIVSWYQTTILLIRNTQCT